MCLCVCVVCVCVCVQNVRMPKDIDADSILSEVDLKHEAIYDAHRFRLGRSARIQKFTCRASIGCSDVNRLLNCFGIRSAKSSRVRVQLKDLRDQVRRAVDTLCSKPPQNESNDVAK